MKTKGYIMAVALGTVLMAGGITGMWKLAPMHYSSGVWGFFTGMILFFALLSGIAFVAAGIYLIIRERKGGKPK